MGEELVRAERLEDILEEWVVDWSSLNQHEQNEGEGSLLLGRVKGSRIDEGSAP